MVHNKAWTLSTTLIRSNRLLAFLLALDGVLNSIYLNDITYVVPFAIAAFEFYTTMPSWRLRRWLILFSAIVILLSLSFGVTFLMDGIVRGAVLPLLQGFSLLVLNAFILAHFVSIARMRHNASSTNPTL